MIFKGIVHAEALFFNLENDKSDVHFVEMERDGDEGIFYVRACCDDEWEWKFFDTIANYELVKHAIIDAAFGAHNMEELVDELDEVFKGFFNEIVVCDCGNECNHCNCK